MADLQECISLFHVTHATRPPGRPIRVIRVAMRHTATWRRDSRYLALSWKRAGDLPEAVRCDRLAATGEHLELERVGLVVR